MAPIEAERPASSWLEDDHDAVEHRALWLEEEARSLDDKAARARGLLVVSELRRDARSTRGGAGACDGIQGNLAANRVGASSGARLVRDARSEGALRSDRNFRSGRSNSSVDAARNALRGRHRPFVGDEATLTARIEGRGAPRTERSSRRDFARDDRALERRRREPCPSHRNRSLRCACSSCGRRARDPRGQRKCHRTVFARDADPSLASCARGSCTRREHRNIGSDRRDRRRPRSRSRRNVARVTSCDQRCIDALTRNDGASQARPRRRST